MQIFGFGAVIWLPLSVGFIVQLYKFLFEWILRRDFDLRVLARAGGMPSSHAAMVCSLVSAIGYRSGPRSDVFALAAVFALVVMYDATGVRRAAGKQAEVLNQILRELFTGQPVSEEELKELIGHSPTEVYVGALIGVLYTVLWFQLSLPDHPVRRPALSVFISEVSLPPTSPTAGSRQPALCGSWPTGKTRPVRGKFSSSIPKPKLIVSAPSCCRKTSVIGILPPLRVW